MARHARLRHAQDRGQFRDVEGLARQHAQQPQPGLVAQQAQEADASSISINVYILMYSCNVPSATIAAVPDAPTLVLAHGAGAGQAHPWMTRVAKGLAARGVSVVTFNFPYMDARRPRRIRPPVLEAHVRQEIWTSVARRRRAGRVFAGGKSMGGRIASQACALGLFDPAPAGLVFFGYPLHPPGKPAQRRDKHLPKIAAPMLFLHGARDPFGSPDEMRELVAGLRGAELDSSKTATIRSCGRSGRIRRDDPSITPSTSPRPG